MKTTVKPMKKVFIAGIGITKFGKHSEKTFRDLAIEAAMKAIDDAGITPKDITELYIGNFAQGMFEGQTHLAPTLYSDLGLKRNIKGVRVENACASGGFALYEAYRAIKAGYADVVLVLGVEKMTAQKTPVVTKILATAGDAIYELPTGITFPGYFALMTTAYFHEFGGSREDLAEIAIKNHYHASRNPYAQYPKQITSEDYFKAPMIAEPLGLYDCSPISDGAAAVVLMSEEYTKNNSSDGLVEVIGAGASVTNVALTERFKDITWLEATATSSEIAFKEAKIERNDVDVVELHDCFTIAEVIQLESLGFYRRGEAINAAVNGETYYDGKLPVNTDGGLKAKGHPIGATGVGMAVEIVKQLRGEAYNQVEGAEIGLMSNMGGSGASNVVVIFRRV